MADTTQILDFLSALRENNQKDWMEANKQQYLQAREQFTLLVAAILEELKPFDPSLEGVEAKDCIFRLHRDIRFSADKAPYKTWFSAVMAVGGRKTLEAVYYLHLQPGNESMLATGLHQPPGEQLKKVRQEIDYNAGELKEIITEKRFQQYFGSIQGEKLSRAPKGYPVDHPNIEFLKLKSYLAIRKLSDEEVKSDILTHEVVETFKAAQPFNEFLNIAAS
ncbi:DUF2461 domain-containing protein [Nafulsella turpanensis]|uniref:DUF2461 domain-containing protein n=1 Tax=Nafulsella turpanensis TaxID=1265690 RepID=UPI00034626A2|nr:DUF2461 domain-containing protein [Nafulsella turpanensis]